jgi:hypothetical protein
MQSAIEVIRKYGAVLPRPRPFAVILGPVPLVHAQLEVQNIRRVPQPSSRRCNRRISKIDLWFRKPLPARQKPARSDYTESENPYWSR